MEIVIACFILIIAVVIGRLLALCNDRSIRGESGYNPGPTEEQIQCRPLAPPPQGTKSSGSQ